MATNDIRLESFYDLQTQSTAILPLITVYYNTLDYPGLYIARLFYITPEITPTRFIVTAKTLRAIRDKIPEQFIPMMRSENDDPVVVETYI